MMMMMMKMRAGGVVVVLWLMVVAGMLTCACCHSPVLHRVGGSKYDGWREHYNYTEWSQNERFYVGDWLYFGFDKHLYTVLEVDRKAYENCDDQNFIKNITRGGRDVFNLTRAKRYYFLSSGGYCWGGMKLEVDVENYAPGAHSPAKNGCSRLPAAGVNLGNMIVTIALTISLVSAASFSLSAFNYN